MFLYWLLGGSLFGLVLQRIFKLWNTLDDKTKKLIIEAVIKAFEEILRAFYRWWKSREGK
jgi:chaperonin GroEL (HSP60 family)